MEFNLADLTGPLLIESIEAHGAVVIRQCMDVGHLQRMREKAERIFSRRLQQLDRGEADALLAEQLNLGHIFPQDLDEPGKQFSLIRFAVDAGLRPLLTRLWDGNVAFLHSNCVPRRQVPGSRIGKAVPFHQDARFVGDPTLILNFWIPLVACGETAPGLEFVTTKQSTILETKLPGVAADYDHIEIDEQRVVSDFGQQSLWHPKLELGDVAVFSHMTIHRTYEVAGMTEPRISVEIRCADGRSDELRRSRGDLVMVKFAQ